MKILFLDTEILPKEKILKFIPTEQNGDQINNPKKNYLYNSPYNVEELLKEIAPKEDIEIAELEGGFVIVINNGSKRYSASPGDANIQNLEQLEYKNIQMLPDSEEVYVSNKRIKLTALEYKLLLFFINNPNKLIPKQVIMNFLWERNIIQQDPVNSLYTHIKNLKKKLINCGNENFIHSIYGQGYKFEGTGNNNDPEGIQA